MNKITIIGTGAYSLAMAKRLSNNSNNSIILWTEDEKKVKEFNDTKIIKSIFKTEKFNENIAITNSFEEALKDTNYIYLMTTSKFIQSTLESMKPFYKKRIPIIIGTKGIDVTSKKYPSQLTKKILKTNNIAVIAGPSFAIDILNNEPLALTVASNKKTIYKKVSNLYTDKLLKFEYSRDMISVQVCSTLKNIYAIGSGIVSKLGYPEATSSIYMTKVLKETYEILYYLDKDPLSFFTLAGLGDTLMTCLDSKSRNYTYGTKIMSKTKNAASNYLNKTTVEGYNTLETMYNLFKKKHIKTPVLNQIYSIVFEDGNKKDLLFK